MSVMVVRMERRMQGKKKEDVRIRGGVRGEKREGRGEEERVLRRGSKID